jgi:hypothetical protein
MAIIKTLNGWLNRLKEKGRKTSKAKETSQSRDGTSTSTPSTETPSLPNPKRSVPKLPVHPVAKPVMTPPTIVARSAALQGQPAAQPTAQVIPQPAQSRPTSSQRTHTPSLLKKTPIWKRAIEKWMIDHPSEYAALGDLGDDPDPKRWTQFQPAAETSQQTTLRLKRWVPVLASVRGIAAPIAALDPHKVAPIICASVFFGIEVNNTLSSVIDADRLE